MKKVAGNSSITAITLNGDTAISDTTLNGDTSIGVTTLTADFDSQFEAPAAPVGDFLKYTDSTNVLYSDLTNVEYV